MKIVVPMAGRGQRFAELAGSVSDYALPKPMIRVMDKPMVRWAVESYKAFLQLDCSEARKPVKLKDLIFVCLREHEEKFGISDFLKTTFSRDVNTVFAEDVTRGPVETALLAEGFIDSRESLIVTDCDHHFDATPLWEAINKDNRHEYVGFLPLMKPEDTEPIWSYVVLNSSKEVIDICEKDVDLAKKRAFGVIGAYYFRRGRDFVSEARRMISENDMVGEPHKEEFYMSRVYQRLINRGSFIKGAFIHKGYILGTPKQLKRFLDKWEMQKLNV